MSEAASTGLRVSDILKTVLKKRKIIIVLAAAGLVVGILLSVVSYLRGEMSKEYAVTSSFAVTSTTRDGIFTSQTNTPSSTDIYLAENMVDSVIYLIKSDRTLDEAISRLDLIGISTKDINKNLTAKQYNETQIVELTLYWRSAEEGVKILDAINSVSPAILIDTLKIGGVSVVNKPTARYIIGGSVKASLWLVCAAFGAIAGIGLCLLQLLVKPTLLNTDDVEKLFDLETLTEIPECEHWFENRSFLDPDTENTDDKQTKIQFSFMAHTADARLTEEKKKFLFISSVYPDEGRSSVLAGLADALNVLEKKVLVVDLDTEQPELGSLFGRTTDYAHSLNAVYRGDAIAQDAIFTARPGFDVLPAVLEERKLPTDSVMIHLLKEISVDYDYVLIDSPATRQAAGIMDLNLLGGTVLWLIRYDTVPVSEIRKTLEHIRRSGLSILGCVVNAIPGKLIRFRHINENVSRVPTGRDTNVRTKRHGTERQLPASPLTAEASEDDASGRDILLPYIMREGDPDDAPMAGQNSAGIPERHTETVPPQTEYRRKNNAEYKSRKHPRRNGSRHGSV